MWGTCHGSCDSKPTSPQPRLCFLSQETCPPTCRLAQHLDSSLLPPFRVPPSLGHHIRSICPPERFQDPLTVQLTVSDPGPGVLENNPQPFHPTPCPPHGGMLLESKFEIISRLNRARSRLWGQDLTARETPRPRPRLAMPLVPAPGPAFPLGLAPSPRLRPRPVPADLAPGLRPAGAHAQFPCSGVHAAQSGPIARRFRGQTSRVSACGWGACGPAKPPHRCSDPSSLPRAQGRCLPASRGPARPSPALREQDGETSDLRDGQARTSWGGGGRFPCHQPGAGRKGPARDAQTELREAGGGSEPRVTGRHPGGTSSGESRR